MALAVVGLLQGQQLGDGELCAEDKDEIEEGGRKTDSYLDCFHSEPHSSLEHQKETLRPKVAMMLGEM